MENWQSKKRSNFPLVALVLCVFISFSILYNEINIQQIRPIHHPRQQQNDAAADNNIGDDDVQNQFSFKEEASNDDNGDDHEHLQQQLSSKEEEILRKHTALLNQTPPRDPPVPLDKYSTCTSTVKYSGKRISSSLRGTREPDDLIGEQKECDFFSGKWVFDNISHPLYNDSDCPYMSDQLACHRHGRPDLAYQQWRWKPHNCNLKRWNVTEMWEKLRGKRLMFVGDSLNRGQWISMLCLLQAAVPADKRSITPQAHLTTFRAEEFNATVEFLWAPLLVESNSDDPVDHRLPQRILRPDSTLRHASEWKHADILVFNSYLWWIQATVNLSWSNAESGVCEEVDGFDGLELAMEAWADWMASNFDFLKKRAFFVTLSPLHRSRAGWDPGTKGNCYGEQLPIPSERYTGRGIHLRTMEIVNKIVRRMSPKVQILNITQLSDYRKDGHPTIYRKFWETLSPEKVANPPSYSDCTHWCLPGVQDVWNELLFQYL